MAIALGSGVAAAQMQSAATLPDAQVEANVLKALAGAPDLANQAVTTTTVYGVVTLSGSVETEAQRTEAETIASRTAGVKKVVDELTLGVAAVSAASANGSAVADVQANGPDPAAGNFAQPQQMGQEPALQGPGAPAMQTGPDSDNTAPAQAGTPQGAPGTGSGPYYGPGAPEYRRPYDRQQGPGYGPPQQGYGPSQQGYGPPPQGYPQRGYSSQRQRAWGGQQEGETVTIPSGALVRIRINQSLDSGRTKPGASFEGIVVNDVVGGGAVAIPRGATVQGVVVEATKSGTLTGRGDLSLQLTQVLLAGRAYPIVTDLWSHHGGDKTIETINKTALGLGIGALVGAAAGGGKGAAIGAGVGGGLGLGSSAASGDGQVYVPSEGILTFHLGQPATVATVSQEEMNRLAQGVPPGAQSPSLRRRTYYPAPYYGPMYGPTFGPVYGPVFRPYNYPYPY